MDKIQPRGLELDELDKSVLLFDSIPMQCV